MFYYMTKLSGQAYDHFNNMSCTYIKDLHPTCILPTTMKIFFNKLQPCSITKKYCVRAPTVT